MKRQKKTEPREITHESIKEDLLRLMSGNHYSPLQVRGLLRQLSLKAEQKMLLESVLEEQVDSGKIVYLRNKGYALSQTADLLSGTIMFIRSGAAFVREPDGEREAFIPAGNTGTAMPGDKVLVRIEPDTQRRHPGMSNNGTVIRVVERKRLTIVGTLKQMRRFFYVEPMSASMSQDMIVPEHPDAKVGDRVLARLISWESPHVSPEGEIIEVIGPADDPALDTIAVIKSHQLPTTFPPEVVQEAEAAAITDADIEGRDDFRSKFIFTIDPLTARDYDDAISLERVAGGNWQLGVHIADVSHFVQLGSKLDIEARSRGTSVYLPDTVIPMLPEQLSNGLCSLVADADRLAFSAIMTLDNDGNLLKSKFCKSVICSRKRLTYEQALEILESDNERPPRGISKHVASKVRQAHELAQKIRQKRMQQGSLEMNIPEVRFLIGEDGRIEGVEPVENDISHQLIEEFMLLANEAVCRQLSISGVPLIHRIHADPDPDKLEELSEMLSTQGIRAGNLVVRKNLVRALEQIGKSPIAYVYNNMILRSMKRAEYSEQRVGHYGLAKEYYTHFTSPIRRYPDLVIHRILQTFLARGKRIYNKDQLKGISQHCSQCETRAAEAERDIKELKKIRFLQEQLESGNPQELQAIITEIRNSGLFIDIPQMQARGMIRVSDLEDDFYDFDPGRRTLTGRATSRTFSIGMTLGVIIAKVDADKRYLDFVPATTLKRSKTAQPRHRRGKKQI